MKHSVTHRGWHDSGRVKHLVTFHPCTGSQREKTMLALSSHPLLYSAQDLGSQDGLSVTSHLNLYRKTCQGTIEEYLLNDANIVQLKWRLSITQNCIIK